MNDVNKQTKSKALRPYYFKLKSDSGNLSELKEDVEFKVSLALVGPARQWPIL